jgi:hypothetical protein
MMVMVELLHFSDVLRVTDASEDWQAGCPFISRDEWGTALHLG